jgi:hypothetical protein
MLRRKLQNGDLSSSSSQPTAGLWTCIVLPQRMLIATCVAFLASIYSCLEIYLTWPRVVSPFLGTFSFMFAPVAAVLGALDLVRYRWNVRNFLILLTGVAASALSILALFLVLYRIEHPYRSL